MNQFSRREFFRQFSHKISDHVDLKKIETDLSLVLPKSSPEVPSDWCAVGNLAQMNPGLAVMAHVGDIGVILSADALGVQARNSLTNLPVALRYEQGGLLSVNLTIEWPQNRFLSHATGEAFDKEIADG